MHIEWYINAKQTKHRHLTADSAYYINKGWTVRTSYAMWRSDVGLLLGIRLWYGLMISMHTANLWHMCKGMVWFHTNTDDEPILMHVSSPEIPSSILHTKTQHALHKRIKSRLTLYTWKWARNGNDFLSLSKRRILSSMRQSTKSQAKNPRHFCWRTRSEMKRPLQNGEGLLSLKVSWSCTAHVLHSIAGNPH